MGSHILLLECEVLGIAAVDTRAGMTPATSQNYPSSQGAFQFVQISYPDGAASNRHKVRSHASRNPRARQERVTKHQRERLNETSLAELDQELWNDVLGPSWHTIWLEPAMTGSILTPLGAARIDPFNTFSRKLTRFEAFLFDHCMYCFPILFLKLCRC